jgi:hypothetical protein
VQSAGRLIGQVDEGITSTRQQVKTWNHGSRSLWVGMQAAWGIAPDNPNVPGPRNWAIADQPSQRCAPQPPRKVGLGRPRGIRLPQKTPPKPEGKMSGM